jgi:hypothetical protein
MSKPVVLACKADLCDPCLTYFVLASPAIDAIFIDITASKIWEN